MSETFGKWLKDKRERLGLTLRDVEQITEGRISNALLSQIETGKIGRPSIVVIACLVSAYALDAEEVFERARTGNKPSAPPLCPTCGQFLRAAPAQEGAE